MYTSRYTNESEENPLVYLLYNISKSTVFLPENIVGTEPFLHGYYFETTKW